MSNHFQEFNKDRRILLLHASWGFSAPLCVCVCSHQKHSWGARLGLQCHYSARQITCQTGGVPTSDSDPVMAAVELCNNTRPFGSSSKINTSCKLGQNQYIDLLRYYRPFTAIRDVIWRTLQEFNQTGFSYCFPWCSFRRFSPLPTRPCWGNTRHVSLFGIKILNSCSDDLTGLRRLVWLVFCFNLLCFFAFNFQYYLVFLAIVEIWHFFGKDVLVHFNVVMK